MLFPIIFKHEYSLKMEKEFKALAGFVETQKPEVEGHAGRPLTEDEVSLIRTVADGQASPQDLKKVESLLDERPSAITLMAKFLKESI